MSNIQDESVSGNGRFDAYYAQLEDAPHDAQCKCLDCRPASKTKGKFKWPASEEIMKVAKGEDGKSEPYVAGVKVFANRLENIQYHLAYQELKATWNELGDRAELNGEHIDEHKLRSLWFDARKRGLPDKKVEYHEAILSICASNKVHPVREYLRSLKWDGTPRVDRLLADYFGAVDTDLNKHFGRVTLLGAVARAMEPACKFDTALILVGPQGSGKSTAVRVLGGRWYSDNFNFWMRGQEFIEQTLGYWIMECPEMVGQTKRNTDIIKGQLGKTFDVARLAYDRTTTHRARHFILVGTTNKDAFLNDPTGDRRFMPVTTGKIDLEALKRDRDQIWAEAFALYRGGASWVLPEAQWVAAAKLQAEHYDASQMDEAVEDVLGGVEAGQIVKDDLRDVLKTRDKYSGAKDDKALADALTRLGWVTAKRKRFGKDKNCWAKEIGPWLRWTAPGWEPLPAPGNTLEQ